MRDFWGLLGMNVPVCSHSQRAGLAASRRLTFLMNTGYTIACLLVLAFFRGPTLGIIRTNKLDLIKGTKVGIQRPIVMKFNFRLAIWRLNLCGETIIRSFRTGCGVDCALTFF